MTSLNDRMEYVQSLLLEYDLGSRSDNKKKIQYSRIDHTLRVCQFAKNIYEAFQDKELVDYDVLMTSIIFHDAGYSDQRSGEMAHADISEDICRKYLIEHQFSDEFIEKVCYIVRNHSDKDLLMKNTIPYEMLIMMEADLFDDTGAMGVVLDTWIESLSDAVTLKDILEHIKVHTNEDMQENPMVTPYSRDLWDKKKELSNEFVRQLENDILEFEFNKGDVK